MHLGVLIVTKPPWNDPLRTDIANRGRAVFGLGHLLVGNAVPRHLDAKREQADRDETDTSCDQVRKSREEADGEVEDPGVDHLARYRKQGIETRQKRKHLP